MEGYPLENFSADAVRSQISEAQKIANGGGSAQDVAEANIELEVSIQLPFVFNSNFLIGPREPAGGDEIRVDMYITNTSFS